MLSRPPTAGLSVRAVSGQTRAVALVLPGGRVRSHARSRPWHLSAVRMIPFARSLHVAGADDGLAVWTVRYRYRGWNGDEASPVEDVRWALDEVRSRHGDVPVALVGHSMGGRTAIRVAGDASVRTVVALAPWLPPDEPYEGLRGRSVLILHGSQDRTTDPAASLALAERAAPLASVRRVEIRGDGHPMLRRAALWQGLTSYFVTSGLDERTDQSSLTMVTNHPYRIPDEGVHLKL
ncbi:MAG TPA: alpha/beta fold hydrolase [Actinomycetes bacterium]